MKKCVKRKLAEPIRRSFSLNAELADNLTKEMHKEKRTLNGLVVKILSEYFEQKEA